MKGGSITSEPAASPKCGPGLLLGRVNVPGIGRGERVPARGDSCYNGVVGEEWRGKEGRETAVSPANLGLASRVWGAATPQKTRG